jgi:hypothetical protein
VHEDQDQANKCRHCPHSIVLDGRGNWTHERIGYACRDQAGVTLKTYAEPPEPWPAVPVVSNSAVGRAVVPRRTQ